VGFGRGVPLGGWVGGHPSGNAHTKDSKQQSTEEKGKGADNVEKMWKSLKNWTSSWFLEVPI